VQTRAILESSVTPPPEHPFLKTSPSEPEGQAVKANSRHKWRNWPVLQCLLNNPPAMPW
jgi:hypothetical protein